MTEELAKWVDVLCPAADEYFSSENPQFAKRIKKLPKYQFAIALKEFNNLFLITC